jgi:hypothetical protein
MLWYFLQIVVIVWLVHLYTTQLAPHQPLGDIVIFASLVAYALTFIISFTMDCLLALLWLIKRSLSRIGGTHR